MCSSFVLGVKVSYEHIFKHNLFMEGKEKQKEKKFQNAKTRVLGVLYKHTESPSYSPELVVAAEFDVGRSSGTARQWETTIIVGESPPISGPQSHSSLLKGLFIPPPFLLPSNPLFLFFFFLIYLFIFLIKYVFFCLINLVLEIKLHQK